MSMQESPIEAAVPSDLPKDTPVESDSNAIPVIRGESSTTLTLGRARQGPKDDSPRVIAQSCTSFQTQASANTTGQPVLPFTNAEGRVVSPTPEELALHRTGAFELNDIVLGPTRRTKLLDVSITLDLHVVRTKGQLVLTMNPAVTMRDVEATGYHLTSTTTVIKFTADFKKDLFITDYRNTPKENRRCQEEMRALTKKFSVGAALSQAAPLDASAGRDVTNNEYYFDRLVIPLDVNDEQTEQTTGWEVNLIPGQTAVKNGWRSNAVFQSIMDLPRHMYPENGNLPIPNFCVEVTARFVDGGRSLIPALDPLEHTFRVHFVDPASRRGLMSFKGQHEVGQNGHAIVPCLMQPEAVKFETCAKLVQNTRSPLSRFVHASSHITKSVSRVTRAQEVE